MSISIVLEQLSAGDKFQRDSSLQLKYEIEKFAEVRHHQIIVSVTIRTVSLTMPSSQKNSVKKLDDTIQDKS